MLKTVNIIEKTQETKTMKKTISIILTVLLLFGTTSFAISSSAAAADVRDYPTIIVPGYSSSDLYLDGKQLWGLDKEAIIGTVLSEIAEFGIGLGELAFKRPNYLADLLGQEMINYVGDLAMNPDGTSVNDVVTYYQDPAHTQFAYLYANEDGDHIHEHEIMKDIARGYGSKGNNYLYAYQQDFRRSQVDCAATLDKYIDDVLEYTGARKVNLVAVSHGGQTVATYLSMFGKEKNVINNILMIVPAIGGVAAAYDLMSETAKLDEETLAYYIENTEMMEEDVNWLVRANQFGILDDVCNRLMDKHVKKILGYWGSIWDFIPAEQYEELKNRELDPVESADLIEKSDFFHYEVLPNVSETFSACIDEGMKIYIVAGAGMPVLTGTREQSDFVLTTNSSTGAKTAPYGKRFSDGYPQERSVCADETHNHLSPDMCVDVSCGYLPDQTWIINGMFHGNTWRDEFCKALCKKLFFSNELVDVNSYAEYPQFQYSSSLNCSVTATLDKSPQGYWSGDDTALTVTNLSGKYQLQILSIAVEGADVTFDIKSGETLEPGGSITAPIKGKIPEVSLKTADITINYYLKDSKTPLGSRTLVFTLENGDAPEYNTEKPYTNALNKTFFDSTFSNELKNHFKQIGLFDFLKMVINTVIAFLKSFKLS